jgi:hypothetical protein
MSKVFSLLLLVCLCSGAARAAVVEVTAEGFSVHQEATATADPKAVYKTLLKDVDQWWNPAHTYSGNSRNLSIDHKVGGCFCEDLGHGGGVEHARVILLIPDSQVRMSGAFGPLQSSALVGTLSFKLTPSGTGTKIEMTYNVGGYMHGAFTNIAEGVDEVLGDQLQRLTRFADTGKPQ